MTFQPPSGRSVLSRRRFVIGAGLWGAAMSAMRQDAWGYAPNWGQPAAKPGTRFNLTIGHVPVNITGQPRLATGVNDSIPAPILRWRQGDTVELNVTNRLDVPTSIHWHGIRTPANMDGVPGLSFAGIKPGETFTYRFPLHQSGTYWYHSHSGFQEQTGLYGALIIDPKVGYIDRFDRDYVIFLSDWADVDPEEIVSTLKFQSDYYNFRQRTVGTFIADAQRDGLEATIKDRLNWGGMRMSPTDISDVSGAIYTYLLNGQPPGANWTGLFRLGERIRLRVINGSAMTLFDVRIPGLKMTVVQADGNDVVPVTVDEFRIGVAETYDVIVQPTKDMPYTIFVQSEDRTGFARGTLATRPGTAGPIPPMDPRPLRTMVDMGMGHMHEGMERSLATEGAAVQSSDGHASVPPWPPLPGRDASNQAVQPSSQAVHGGMTGMKTAQHAGMRDMPGMTMSGMHQAKASASSHAAHTAKAGNMAGMNMGSSDMASMSGMDTGQSMTMNAPETEFMLGPEEQNRAMSPIDRLGEPGAGLENNGRRVLTYRDLRARVPGADPRPPSRDITLHLTGNMQRFIWGFDGKKFSEADPIHLRLGERVRFILINDTMMEHPIHLHGLWSELDNGHGKYRPYKHTITVKPGEQLSYLVTADEPGMWAYHCHLLYHMDLGMFRTVVVS
ncbi:copper resistance system multicopper oxidase [Beijerinckia mobilis]|uniref:copper resistance system multicopper oxidase n=1 Tax=Beijerinckia mobilis TaxID=231434 RepID=UPI00068C919B|nr:copper resistance system multicopper oxidase [Beijerinckia mobilis]